MTISTQWNNLMMDTMDFPSSEFSTSLLDDNSVTKYIQQRDCWKKDVSWQTSLTPGLNTWLVYLILNLKGWSFLSGGIILR